MLDVIAVIIYSQGLATHLLYYGWGHKFSRAKHYLWQSLLFNAVACLCLFAYLGLFQQRVLLHSYHLKSVLSFAFLAMINIMAAIIYRFNHHHLFESLYETIIDKQVAISMAAIYAFVLTDNLVLMSMLWIFMGYQIKQIVKPIQANITQQQAINWSLYLSNALFICATALYYYYSNSVIIGTQIANYPLCAVLLCISVLLRSAQYPAYSWMFDLINKPVSLSALMHAGLINLGGFFLIAYSPFLLSSIITETICVMCGLLSIHMTLKGIQKEYRYKHKLVYSTSLQMGFMFIEMGLGYVDLAFVHLVAHAFFKAGRFLLASHYPLIIKHFATATQPLSLFKKNLFLLIAVLAPILASTIPNLSLDLIVAAVFIMVMYLATQRFVKRVEFAVQTTWLGIFCYIALLSYFEWAQLFSAVKTNLYLYYVVTSVAATYINAEAVSRLLNKVKPKGARNLKKYLERTKKHRQGVTTP